MRTTIHPDALRMISRSVGIPVEIGDTHGRYTIFRLRLPAAREDGTRPFQRVRANKNGGKPYRINSLCFHGHYAFMRAMFEWEPDAVIVSQLARYNGRRDFEVKAPEVGTARPPHTLPGYEVGRHGPAFEDTCTCTETERDNNGGC